MERISGSGFTIDWSGDEVVESFTDAMRQRLETAAAQLEDRLKNSISKPVFPRSSPGEPPRMETAKLHDSVFHQADENGDLQTVGTDVLYGLFLERGTGPRVIRARPGMKMRWFDHDSQEWIEAKEVHIQGIKARPWVAPGMKEFEKVMKDIMAEPIDLSGGGT